MIYLTDEEARMVRKAFSEAIRISDENLPPPPLACRTAECQQVYDKCAKALAMLDAKAGEQGEGKP